jgi:hypothetical protein
VRSSGVLDAPTGLGYHDHACWGYDDREEFVSAARPYLAEGLRLGQRVVYVARGSTPSLRLDLEGIDDLDALVARGAVELHDVSATYDAETGDEQVDAWVEATWQAVADGYTGLRVVADVTDFVIDGDDRLEFVLYEHAVDRLMGEGLPLTGLCAYDLDRLGPAFDELACVHPFTHGATCTFGIFAVRESGLGLTGEVDTLATRAFVQALDRLLPTCRQPVTIDCSRLRFIDHRSLLAMDDAAARADVSVALVGVSPLVLWLSNVLPLHALEIARP